MAGKGRGGSGRTQATERRRLWAESRSGARAGRGFHYQDVVGAWLCGRVMSGDLAVERIVPEGWEDLSCEGSDNWHVQVKSRQARVGGFLPGDVARYLLKMAAQHDKRMKAGLAGRMVLVLESPVAGERLSVWGQALAELPRTHPLRVAVHTTGRERKFSQRKISELCALVSVYVLPWREAAEQTGQTVADKHGLLPLAAGPVVLALRDAIAGRADTNATPDLNSRAGLDRTDIERVTTRAAALVDRASLQEALSVGLCEPVDFDEPLVVPGFFEGTEVQPGHIAAGLPAPRPVESGQVVDALERAEPVLVTGPSGVGKSMVMWAAAYSARHILWYRVRRLREADVDALVRLARASGASARSPVGFAVDGVGVGSADAWDLLQRELAPLPGVHLLGSARTEDLPPLRTLPNCTVVEVALNEAVAQEIHTKLLGTSATTVPHWRAAFEQANGLTLEYTHLLTRGRRLSAVVTEQVQRRITEDRETELQILARVALAHQWGAALPLRTVQAQLGVGDGAFRIALARLGDEHLIHVQGQELTGLHQLRSRALADAVHASPPPSLDETLAAVLETLDSTHLRPFTSGALAERPDLDEKVLAGLVTEIGRRPGLATLTAVLQALRLVDMQRRAEQLNAVLRRHHVRPAHQQTALLLARLDSELPDVRPEIASAIAEIRPTVDNRSPLRDNLLARIGATAAVRDLNTCADASAAQAFLTVLEGSSLDLAAHIGSALSPSPLALLLSQQPVDVVGDVIGAARGVSLGLAQQLVTLAGGTESILTRLRAYSRWLVELDVVEQDGSQIARTRLLHVSDRAQPDLEEAVRHFGRVLLRCLPACDRVDVQALMPGDVPLQIGDYLGGVSRLQRRYDYLPSVVTWNRLQAQVAMTTPDSMDATMRTHTAVALISDLYHYLDDLTRTWCLRQGQPEAPATLETRRNELYERSTALTLPVNRAQLLADPVDDAVSATPHDHLSFLAQGITANLTGQLVTPEPHWTPLAAYTGDTLRKLVQQVRQSERWELVGLEAPPADLNHIDQKLSDLHAVLAELARGGLQPATISAAAGSRPPDDVLTRLATRARSDAERRASHVRAGLLAAAETAGVSLRVLMRPLADAAAVNWAAVETAIGIQISDLTEWEQALPTVIGLLEQVPEPLGAHPPVLIIPLIAGHPVRHLAVKAQTDPWPGVELYDTWADRFPPAHATPLTDSVIAAHQALQALSGFTALRARQGTTPETLADITEETDRYRRALDTITEIQPTDIVISTITEFLTALHNRVAAEDPDHPEHNPEQPPFAASLALHITGTTTPDAQNLDGLTTISLQRDLDPESAIRLLTESQ
ncbi:hypothetical protein GA0115240_12043 [Streptomyces sp. DvalAA-14]|uniref:hypothetical protein n=1 Tax=unclassified Streptomyces TaxID=2593676 RepID=UPI00081B457E|nr:MULTISPECIES: hypothetical protein [unclassified Streptomyces]MYS20482.1 hypothetical protein [Streptomyces sp. SID4948]SCD70024.1 hypothetical protein GA0115240_12043 [Streptomyces sp. DvalAA-14]